MFERDERTANTTSRTPQRRARETTLDGQGAVQGILWCSAGSKNYGDLKKELNTKPEKQFPTDCPGPLESPHCSSTCFKKTITGSPTACEKTSTSTI
ncbi:hypothetical protein ACLKA7_000072 [Drosophila subpalustris]